MGMDRKMQSCAFDEFVYHECLVHPAMLNVKNPKNVFIGGGGEFATAREVLRHKSVEKCVMVDIDQEACEACLKYIPEFADGCTKDPRLELKFEDAYAALEKDKRKFDVIIMDINDPMEAGPGIRLYYKQCYEMIKSKLTPGGIFVTQSGAGNINTDCFCVINHTMASVFDTVVPYTADVVSFGSSWAWNMGFCRNQAGKPPYPTATITDRTVADVDKQIDQCLTKETKYLDGITYRGIFCLPKITRKQIAAEKRIMTKDTPVFLY